MWLNLYTNIIYTRHTTRNDNSAMCAKIIVGTLIVNIVGRKAYNALASQFHNSIIRSPNEIFKQHTAHRQIVNTIYINLERPSVKYMYKIQYNVHCTDE